LFIEREGLPDSLQITASTDDGLIMGLEHRTLPISDISFADGTMRYLGVEIVQGGVSASVLNRVADSGR